MQSQSSNRLNAGTLNEPNVSVAIWVAEMYTSRGKSAYFSFFRIDTSSATAPARRAAAVTYIRICHGGDNCDIPHHRLAVLPRNKRKVVVTTYNYDLTWSRRPFDCNSTALRAFDRVAPKTRHRNSIIITLLLLLLSLLLMKSHVRFSGIIVEWS